MRELITSRQKKRAHTCHGASRRSSQQVPPQRCERSRETPKNIFRGKRLGFHHEGKQPAAKAKKTVEPFGSVGGKVRRRPGERVRRCSLWLSLVAARRVGAKERRGGDGGGAARYRRTRRWMMFRHTVDGENFTRLSRKIEEAETESQLAPQVGRQNSWREGVGAWGIEGLPSSILIRTVFHRSAGTRPSPRTSDPHCTTPCRFYVPQVGVVEEESCALDITSAS